MVLTSSSPALPAHLPPCTPLPAFQLLLKALTDQFCLQLGRQDPQPPPPVSAFLLLHKPGHWGPAQPTHERCPPKGRVPLLQQTAATDRPGGSSSPWVTAGPFNTALPSTISPRSTPHVNLPSLGTPSPSTSSNSAISLNCLLRP